MSKKKKILVCSSAILVGIFCSYIYFSDNIIKNDNIARNEEKAVYNSAEKVLDGNLKIQLFTEDKKDKEFTIDNFKEKEGKETITEGYLSNVLKKEGYSLVKKDDKKLEYKRDKKASLVKNSYYIGVEKESIALFRTDESGNLILEKNYDYPVSILPQIDREKLESFEYFNSTDMNEIERKLSEFGVKF